MKIRDYNLGYYYVPYNISGVCVDIGANVGSFIQKNIKSFSLIHYYEAYHPNYNKCIEVLSEFDNVIGYNEAVSAEDGNYVQLLIPNNKDCGSIAVDSDKIKIKSENWSKGNFAKKVLTVSLETIIFRAGGFIDYMKVDCETSEYNFLIGKDLSKIGIIAIEIHCQLGESRVNQLTDHILKTHELIPKYSKYVGFKPRKNQQVFFKNKNYKINTDNIFIRLFKKIKRTLLIYIYYPIKNFFKKRKHFIEYDNWIKNKEPVPPPHFVKQKVILDFAEKYKIRNFIETGTHRGDMLEAVKPFFNKIYSIELSKELFNQAKIRFYYDKKIRLFNGDSGVEINNILPLLNEISIFWLDGHYSGGNTALGNKRTPIYKELEAIFKHINHEHIILIDDARVFGIETDYPLIEELTKYIKSQKIDYNIEVKYDCIRLIPDSLLEKN